MPDAPLFPEMPTNARCWIYAADSRLDAATQEALHARLTSFLEGWTSHQRAVHGAVTIRDDRFLMVAAYVEGGDVSGCGIDSLVHAVDEAAAPLGISWARALSVFYRDADGRVQAASRGDFRAQVQEGTVTARTPVFDPSLTTLGAVRSRFEQPAGDSWHARLFRIPTPA